MLRSCIALLFAVIVLSQCATAQEKFFPADHPYIQYTGRIDFSNPKLPRFWQPGVYITARFMGEKCEVIINDEMLYGNKHNYIEIVVDGKTTRLKTKGKCDTIVAAEKLSKGIHTLTICKNTEANIGYNGLVGIHCEKLLKPLPGPKRKIEFIGNSITCAASADESAVPCGKGVWEDQHNAYMSYGAITARALNAQYHLSSVSGIGLMHSCCNMDIIMPPVFDKVSMRDNKIQWDFNKYQPDVVTICLGQNDGIQDSAAFCNNYIAFIKQLRSYYPKANLVCLSSPMASNELAAFMKKTLVSIVNMVYANGDKKISYYFFSRSYNGGCDWHPSLAEHKLIAKELTAYLKKQMKWN